MTEDVKAHIKQARKWAMEEATHEAHYESLVEHYVMKLCNCDVHQVYRYLYEYDRKID